MNCHGLDWTVTHIPPRAAVAGTARPAPRMRRRPRENRIATSRAHYRFVERLKCMRARARRRRRGQRVIMARRRVVRAPGDGPALHGRKEGHHRVVTRNGRARCGRCGDWRSIAASRVYLVVFVGLAVIWLAGAQGFARGATLADRLGARVTGLRSGFTNFSIDAPGHLRDHGHVPS